MQITNILAFAAVFAAAAVDALPARDRAGRPTRATTLSIFRHESKKQHPSKAFLSTLSRFNKDEFAARQAAAAASNVPMTDFSDSLWTVPFSVGSNQQFTIDLDTGSSDVWFHGSGCQSSDGSCGGTGNQLNVKDSKITSTGQTYSESYGSGSVSGNVYTGPVTLGSYTVPNLAFGASTKETGFSSPGVGLFGLAFSGLNSISVANSNFIAASSIGVFSMYLSQSKISGDVGEITLGGIDSAKYSGSISYVPNNGGSTFYQFDNSGSFSVNGKSTSVSGNAIADSGTTQIVLTTTDANTINAAIGAGSDGSISCTATGPAIQFTFGSPARTYEITSDYYIIDGGNNSCFSGFGGGAESLGGMVIYGDVFIRKYYTIFDVANTQIGFADAVHPGSSPVSQSTAAAPSSTTAAGPSSSTAGAPSSTTNAIPSSSSTAGVPSSTTDGVPSSSSTADFPSSSSTADFPSSSTDDGAASSTTDFFDF